MHYWPFWIGGIALAAVAVAHWFGLGRMLAVSGRISALVDRVRHGPPEPSPAMTQEELIAAMRAATLEEFGECAAEPAPEDPAPGPSSARAPQDGPPGSFSALAHPPSRSQTPLAHVLFFAGLALGGLTSAALAGTLAPTAGVASPGLARLTGGSVALEWALLLVGGVLVGFGTRMAGGCTSGHGLCGVSRLQWGSIAATMAFFGAGILAAFALGALR